MAALERIRTRGFGAGLAVGGEEGIGQKRGKRREPQSEGESVIGSPASKNSSQNNLELYVGISTKQLSTQPYSRIHECMTML